MTGGNDGIERPPVWEGISVPTKAEVLSEAKRVDLSEYRPPDASSFISNGNIPPWYCYVHFDSFDDLYHEMNESWKYWSPESSWTDVFDMSDAEFLDGVATVYDELDRFPTHKEIEVIGDMETTFAYQFFGGWDVVNGWSMMMMCFAVRERVAIPHERFPSNLSRTGQVFTGFSTEFLDKYLQGPHAEFVAQFIQGDSRSRNSSRTVSVGKTSKNERWAYDVLDVEEDASEKDIEQAFRQRVLETHPDTGGDAGEFKRVKEAYSTLCN